MNLEKTEAIENILSEFLSVSLSLGAKISSISISMKTDINLKTN